MSLEFKTFQEITVAKLKIGTQIKFRGKSLIYAGETFGKKDDLTNQRMICLEEGKTIQYRADKWGGVYKKEIETENPLYYPYKELLEAQE